jgi:hypothetical protein
MQESKHEHNHRCHNTNGVPTAGYIAVAVWLICWSEKGLSYGVTCQWLKTVLKE